MFEFFSHFKCRAEISDLQLELLCARADLSKTDFELGRVKRQLQKAQDAEARSWATVQGNEAYIRHLEQHIQDLEAAIQSK